MNEADLVALAPMFALSGGCVAVMLSIAWRRSNLQTACVTGFSIVAALLCLLPRLDRPALHIPPLFLLDGYFLFTCVLVLGSALIVLLLAIRYVGELPSVPADEYYLLLLIATLGAVVMLASDHFVTFFLGLETLSVALLGLIAYPRHRLDATEAAMKYLVLAGTSSAMLLFGIALIYAVTGSLSFAAPSIAADNAAHLYKLAALGLILAGIGYKLSIVPFHMWAPDIYEGAPAPSAAFVAVISKISVFTVLMRYFVSIPKNSDHSTILAITLFATLSMIVGNLLALSQRNLKRLLAYSSIAHVGYLLVAFLAPASFGIDAAAFYLAAYAVTSLGAFGVISVLSDPVDTSDAGSIESYRGLFWRRPWIAALLTIMLMSLAGIPPTIGFFGKAYVMLAGVGGDLSLPLAALVVGSIMGLYYYLRVVVTMVLPADMTVPEMRPGSVSSGVALATVAVLTVVLGIYPAGLIPALRATALHASPARQQLAEVARH